MRKHIVSFLIIFLVVFGSFWIFPKTFFQQDEWAIFGNMIYTQLTNKDIFGVILPQSGLSHVVPFTRIVTRVLFDLFSLDFYPQAIISLFVHTLNSFLVYILSYLFLRRWSVSLLAAVLFATNVNTHQATTWLATNIGTQGCALFLLLSMICFVLYLREKKIIYMWLSAFSWLLSLGFKENSFFLLFLFPLYYIVSKKNKIFNLLKTFIPFGIIFILYFATRFFIAFSAPSPPGPTMAYSQPGLSTLTYRLISLPFKSYIQVLIPIKYLLHLSSRIIYYSYPQFLDTAKNPNPYLVESVGVDIIMLLFTILFFVFLYTFVISWGKKSREIYNVVLLCILYIPFSVVLLIFIGGRAGFSSLIEPRNLYYPAVGGSILLSLSLERLKDRFSIYLLFVVLIIYVNIKLIGQDMEVLIGRSSVRKNILASIHMHYPRLPKKVIFFTQSDTVYYGLTETMLPFQSGLGQTLLVWYYSKSERFPVCFFDYHEDFLYAIESQDYRECEGRGFGYFRSYPQLLTALRANKLSPEVVIAFRWIDKNKQLIDKTVEIRNTLLKDL